MRSLSLHYTFLWMDVGACESNLVKAVSGSTKVCTQDSAVAEREASSAPRPIRGLLVLSSTVTLWTRPAFSFHRKHNLSARYEPPLPQTPGRADLVPPPSRCNKSPRLSFLWFSADHYLHRSSSLSVSFVPSFTVSLSLFFPFLLLARWPSGGDKSRLMTASVSTPCHSLMSWDSNILARVFFTLRAVRREAGLWAQHSDINFPICRRHWRHKGQRFHADDKLIS